MPLLPRRAFSRLAEVIDSENTLNARRIARARREKKNLRCERIRKSVAMCLHESHQ